MNAKRRGRARPVPQGDGDDFECCDREGKGKRPCAEKWQIVGKHDWRKVTIESGQRRSARHAADGHGRSYERSEKETGQEATHVYVLPNDIEFSGEEEGAQRLTMSPLQ